MKKIAQKLNLFCVSSSGATLVEYGVALIVAIVVGASAISALGTAVGNEIAETASAF
ncbi:Flp family type IVb pilin [Alphaproteobacteria bacterium GH1-50]|uniref:Flp family type IVb pilin n=1 Tax=Kangsaoukella pontilimi TaxID=2691042 RepID=A0A7C9INR6_9RHOB|nr:Flp family type IVb pilin [Kangsaoukella pontilimi]MXQ07530.1 Flp family type IVb pilin [Kangsaoukella pontilimi]